MMDAGKTDMKENLEGSFCDPSNNCTWPTPNTGEELKIAASVICFHFFHGWFLKIATIWLTGGAENFPIYDVTPNIQGMCRVASYLNIKLKVQLVHNTYLMYTCSNVCGGARFNRRNWTCARKNWRNFNCFYCCRTAWYMYAHLYNSVHVKWRFN